MKLYRIAKWSTTYETHETRKLTKLAWVPMPNKHDGLGFRLMSAEKDNTALFACWMLLVQLASKSDRDERGMLIRDKIALDARGMSLMTGFPEKAFERALSFFSQANIGWLLVEELQTNLPLSPGAPGENPDMPGKSPGRIEGNGMERREGKEVGRAAVASPASDRSDSEFLESLKINPAYQGIDVQREYGKMHVWCTTNKKQPSRKRFTNWLNRIDPPMGLNRGTTLKRDPNEPTNWRARMKTLCPDWIGHGNSKLWNELMPYERQLISETLDNASL